MSKRFAAVIAVVFAVMLFLFYATLTSAAPPQISPVEVAMSADQPAMTEAEFVAPAPSRVAVVPAAPAAATEGWRAIAETAIQGGVLAVIVWIVKLVGPILLRAADWFGQRATVESLLQEKNQIELSGIISKLALNYALSILGKKPADLTDAGVRFGVLKEANAWGKSQWPDDWQWITKGIKLPKHVSPEMLELSYLEGRLAEHMPAIDPTTYRSGQVATTLADV